MTVTVTVAVTVAVTVTVTMIVTVTMVTGLLIPVPFVGSALGCWLNEGWYWLFIFLQDALPK